jgi:hypothetical protein
MLNITRKELEEMKMAGAEIEIEPQRMVVEGLIDQLRALVPDNSEVLSEIRKLTEAITNLAAHSTVVECTPQIDCTPVVNPVNNVTVDMTPLTQAMDRMMHRPNYRFTVHRNNRGFIESMDAEAT